VASESGWELELGYGIWDLGSGHWALGLGSGVWDHVEVHKTQANKQAFHGKQHSEGERVEAEGLDSSFTRH